jgi:hypothetical protein
MKINRTVKLILVILMWIGIAIVGTFFLGFALENGLKEFFP